MWLGSGFGLLGCMRYPTSGQCGLPMMPMIAPCFSFPSTVSCNRMAKLKTSAPSARVLSQLLPWCSFATGPAELKNPATSDDQIGAFCGVLKLTSIASHRDSSGLASSRASRTSGGWTAQDVHSLGSPTLEVSRDHSRLRTFLRGWQYDDQTRVRPGLICA
jgi:hypothetical protein